MATTFCLQSQISLNKSCGFHFVDIINLRAALIYDAVMVFATAITELGREQVLPTKVLCDDPSTNWNKVQFKNIFLVSF